MVRARFLKRLAACLLGMLVLAGTAAAQVRNFDIPKGDLKSALDAYAQQTGLQVIYRTEDVRGVMTAGVHGALDANAALKSLLAKTGFRIVRESDGAIAIVEAVPVKTSAENRSGDAGKTLETINVTAKVEGLSATRVPTELREIPQSVSVTTQDILQQQNAFDLVSALDWATGITLIQSNTNQVTFASRGFQIGEIHIDGGAALSQTGGSTSTLDDLSEYDHLEILRGADGLFGGSGAPGATVNLVRKQPLATPQASLTATLGDWDYYHLQLDATGPLGFDGALRGRVVTSSTSQHFFYEGANKQANKIYGVIAYDLSPSTVLTAGGSVEQSNTTGMDSGLPRYANGDDPHLPRSTAIVFPWDRDHQHDSEAFVQLEQRFGDDWKFKLGVTRTYQQVDDLFGGDYASINPFTNLLYNPPSAFWYIGPSRRLLVDATLTGGFDWNGRRQDITAGMDYARADNSYTADSYFTLPGPQVLNPWNYDPTAYPLPPPPSPDNPVNRTMAEGTNKAIGAYVALRLRPWDGWSVILGGRDNYQRNDANFSSGSNEGSAGIQWFLQNSRHLLVSAGVVTPYAGLVYDIDRHYSLYASYADIYQPAYGLQTYTGQVIPPMQGVNVEAGIKAAWYGGLLNGSLAWYNIRQSNNVVFDPNHPLASNSLCCFLAATNTSKGVEAELSGHMGANWQWSAGYTFNVNHQDADLPATITGGPAPTLSQSPKHLLKLWTNYQFGEGRRWSVGGGLRAQTANYWTGTICTQPDPQSSSGNCPVPWQPYRSMQGFYTVVTLRAAYRINPHWSAALNIDNLFDRIYYQTIGAPDSGLAGSWYGTPRNLMLTLTGTL